MGLNQPLGCLDVGPGGLLGEEIGKEDFTAVVINGRDQGPFLGGKGRPQMRRAVVLDQSADRGSQDLSIVGFPFLPSPVAAQFFGSIDDGCDRNLDPFVLEPVSQCRVIVVRDGEVWILNDLFFTEKSCLDFCRHFGRQPCGRSPSVGDREVVRVLSISSP